MQRKHEESMSPRALWNHHDIHLDLIPFKIVLSKEETEVLGDPIIKPI